MPQSRRSFLAKSALGASALGLPAAGALGANETMNIGLIGTGGRCRFLMRSLAKVPRTRMAAICDVYEPHLNEARKLADPRAFATADFHALLRRKDIDAVLIASPDHWHVPMTVAAMQAGKDVYVEKPLTHNLAEGATILQALAKHKRVVQIGTQQRSMTHIIRARELVRAGRLGDIYKVHLTWNRNSDRIRRGNQNVDPKKLNWNAFLGNAPKQDFDAYRFRNWRWFWDFGNGILTDLMVHWIDVAHWILNLDHPLKAVTIGNHCLAQGVWETPDTIQTLLSYPGNRQIYFEGTFANARNGSMIEFMGTQATLYIDRGRFELIPEPRHKGKPEQMILGEGPKGRDFYDRPDGELLHLTNWVDAIRNGNQPSAPIEAGVSAAAAAHLGNQAYRQNRLVEWKG